MCRLLLHYNNLLGAPRGAGALRGCFLRRVGMGLLGLSHKIPWRIGAAHRPATIRDPMRTIT